MGGFFMRPIKEAGSRADILGLGFPPYGSPHYYLLQPLDFLSRQACGLGKAFPSCLFFRKHIKELLRLIDFDFSSVEIAAVASDDGIGTLADG